MTLAPQTLLGPYQVISQLGAGGMGEVYRAKDTRLGREVALKVLPPQWASDAEFVQRFDREAKLLSSISHPNITVIHDVGHEDGVYFLVTELLEGQTLQERLSEGAIGPRKVVELAAQIAHGLAAAHDRGIVHRDLKPANVFLTSNGHIKILDFGLARSVPSDGLETQMDSGNGSATLSPDRAELQTRAGMVMGTVSYMSPEQVRGLPCDPRSDIFSFGILLYEMLTGRRPFQGDSAVETMNAILKEDPPDLQISQAHLAPALERILRHCLEKAPAARFQSARDLAFDLEALSSVSGAQAATGTPLRKKRWIAALALGLASMAVGGGLVLALRTDPKPATFQPQTFRQGLVTAARFVDGAQNLVFSARWSDGSGSGLYTSRLGNPDSRQLEGAGTSLLSISKQGELAVALQPTSVTLSRHVLTGTLAQVSLAGGGSRELAESICEADWSPDGTQLAVIRYQEGECHLEFPLGTPLAHTNSWYSSLRISPNGRYLAYLHHPILYDNAGVLHIYDLKTHREQELGPRWSTSGGLAWAPKGKAVWLSAVEKGIQQSLFEIDLSGKCRQLMQIPGGCQLMDVAANGRALVAHNQLRRGILVQGAPDEVPRDLAWLHWSSLGSLSWDGTQLLIMEGAANSSTDYEVYLRPTTGEPGVKVGLSSARPAISPDQRTALVLQGGERAKVVLIPLGSGEPRVLPLPTVKSDAALEWMPDGKRFLVFQAEREASSGQILPKLYLQSLEDRSLNPVSLPKDFAPLPGLHLSPNGRHLVVFNRETGFALLDLENPGHEPQPVKGLGTRDSIIGWHESGTHLFVRRYNPEAVQVDRVQWETGLGEAWRSLKLGSAMKEVVGIRISRNGKVLVVATMQTFNQLYAVEGLR